MIVMIAAVVVVAVAFGVAAAVVCRMDRCLGPPSKLMWLISCH